MEPTKPKESTTVLKTTPYQEARNDEITDEDVELIQRQYTRQVDT